VRNVDVLQERRYLAGKYARPGDPGFSAAAMMVLNEVPIQDVEALPAIPRVLVGVPKGSPAYAVSLRLFHSQNPTASIPELTQATGLNPDVVRNTVFLLINTGRVERRGASRYQLTPRYRNLR
jgi:hypothetical protein